MFLIKLNINCVTVSIYDIPSIENVYRKSLVPTKVQSGQIENIFVHYTIPLKTFTLKNITVSRKNTYSKLAVYFHACLHLCHSIINVFYIMAKNTKTYCDHMTCANN